MAVDRLVLLKPRQRSPLESHQAGDGTVAVVEYARRRVVCLCFPDQGEHPRRTELNTLGMVVVPQETGSDVREWDVVLRVVRHLPHVPRRRRVEDQFMAEEAAN